MAEPGITVHVPDAIVPSKSPIVSSTTPPLRPSMTPRTSCMPTKWAVPSSA